jgi:serine/threonine protein kinase
MRSGDLAMGAKLGTYTIKAQIGAGATGVVYRAERAADKRMVALKVLHENLGSITGLERRFQREARVLKKLSHPNIVEVLDFGVESGRTFIAMEVLDGITLEQKLEQGPLPPDQALAMYDPILAALAEAHSQEVVHRDLKPANVFLTKSGDVKVLDFGLAKMLSVDELSQEGTLTRRGRIVGTPAYMAPEQITGVFIDVRADVYALGVMLFELLADRRPFMYERRSELLRAHLLEPVPRIMNMRPGLWVHPDLEALIMSALTKDPSVRYANGGAMLAALRALPKDCVRFENEEDTILDRTRGSTTSAVISDSERRAITEQVALESQSQELRVYGGTETVVDSQQNAVPRVPAAAFVEKKSSVSTTLLFAISIVLLLAAAALFFTIVRPVF